MDKTCEKCNKIFSTKYTLKIHVENNKCTNVEKQLKKCSSSKCEYSTENKKDLQKHLKICRFVEKEMIEHQHSKEIEAYQKQIEEQQREMESIKREHQREMEYLKREHQHEIENIKQKIELRLKNEWMEEEKERLNSFIEKAVSKPIVNNTTTNIRGNNNNLQQILAPNDLYQKQVDPERIMNIDRSIIEKYFWLGQRGMAKMCIDHIVKAKDDNGNSKLLLCCTDPSRKRFKYIDATNNIAEDMDARHFINTVSIPIKTVCRDVFDDIIKRIEEEKKDTEHDQDLLDNKTTIAQQKFLEINDISDHKRNSDYKNEMSILLNT